MKMKKSKNIIYSIILLTIIILNISNLIGFCNNSVSNEETQNTFEEKISSVEVSNFTVISDGYLDVYWNEYECENPSIIMDSTGKFHSVWDCSIYINEQYQHEIFYASSDDGISWSNITIVSNDYTNWNSGWSELPDIAVDSNDKIHIVWSDDTDGTWGTDSEIMYVSNDGSGWSNATVISDDENHWNNGDSVVPKIVINSNDKIHVIWQDDTEGIWGGGYHTDIELMDVSSLDGITWSNATVISDGYSGFYWKTGIIRHHAITVDNNNNNIYVIWTHSDSIGDSTTTDMFVTYKESIGWSNVTLLSTMGIQTSYSRISNPDIVADNDGIIHIVTNQFSGGNNLLCYISYSEAQGWSEPKIIPTDLHNPSSYDDIHIKQSIDVDSYGTIHIAYVDVYLQISGGHTSRYVNYLAYNNNSGLLENKAVSNSFFDMNDAYLDPSIEVNSDGSAYVVWVDPTTGPWTGQYNEKEVFFSSIYHNPNLDNPEDITYEQDMTGYSITWNPTGVNPHNYTIKNGENIVQSGNWTNDIPIDIDVDGLSYGLYTYKINVTNKQGRYFTDSVNVNVSKPLNPEISEPLDLTFEEDETDHSIFWTATDLNANNYTISNSTYIIQTGEWTSGNPIELKLGSIKQGIYNFEIEIFDKGNHSSIDSVVVDVTPPLKPDLTPPENITYVQNSKGNTISWTGFDLFPDDYIITRNASYADSGNWDSEHPIILEIDGLPEGLYIYKISIYDKARHVETNSVWVLVTPDNQEGKGLSLGYSAIIISIISIIGIVYYTKRKLFK